MDRSKHFSPFSPTDEITNLLGEFLEVAITLLLCVRGIYPPEIFERRRYLNVPVQYCRHPELREYVNTAISTLKPWIQRGILEKLAVVIIDKNHVPLEKFVFQLRVNQSFSGLLPVDNIEYALRAFLLKLSVSQPVLRSLPPDCTWEILVYSRQLPGDASGMGHYWIPAETKHWQQPPLITPIKSMDSEPVGVQLYIEHPVP